MKVLTAIVIGCLATACVATDTSRVDDRTQVVDCEVVSG